MTPPEYVKGIVWEDVLVLRRGTLADAGENGPVCNILGNGSPKTRQTRIHAGTSVGLRSERRGREEERGGERAGGSREGRRKAKQQNVNNRQIMVKVTGQFSVLFTAPPQMGKCTK